MNFSERLKMYRNSYQLTQQNVADSVGISIRGYQQYEQGKFEPNIEKLMKLADIFAISLDELVGHEYPPKPKPLHPSYDIQQILLNQDSKEVCSMFSKKLKEVRKSRGKTQKEMAEILSMAPNAYQRYELGTSEPNLQKLMIISAILDISLDDLLCRDEFLKRYETEC